MEIHASAALGIALLIGVVLIKYSGYKERISHPLGFFVAAALFLFLDAATGCECFALGSIAQVQANLGMIWQIIAWILILIGTFMSTIELTRMKKK